MDDTRLTELLQQKIEWMGRLYEEVEDFETYQWTKAPRTRHRCAGEIYVYV